MRVVNHTSNVDEPQRGADDSFSQSAGRRRPSVAISAGVAAAPGWGMGRQPQPVLLLRRGQPAVGQSYHGTLRCLPKGTSPWTLGKGTQHPAPQKTRLQCGILRLGGNKHFFKKRDVVNMGACSVRFFSWACCGLHPTIFVFKSGDIICDFLGFWLHFHSNLKFSQIRGHNPFTQQSLWGPIFSIDGF